MRADMCADGRVRRHVYRQVYGQVRTYVKHVQCMGVGTGKFYAHMYGHVCKRDFFFRWTFVLYVWMCVRDAVEHETHLCIDMCADMRVDMCTGLHGDIGLEMCIGMSTGLCMERRGRPETRNARVYHERSQVRAQSPTEARATPRRAAHTTRHASHVSSRCVQKKTHASPHQRANISAHRPATRAHTQPLLYACVCILQFSLLNKHHRPDHVCAPNPDSAIA